LASISVPRARLVVSVKAADFMFKFY